MLSEYPYATFANYSPRGMSKTSIRSRRICGKIKAGSVSQIEKALPHLKKPEAEVLKPFLNPDVTLVPVPRSAPLTEGALWPSKVLAEVLAENGYGRDVSSLIERVTAVRKSSSSPASERPLIDEHKSSMRVNSDLIYPDKVTLIDDVLTMGRTTFACASLLQEAMPNTEIRIFAMIRTQGMVEDIETVLDPSVGTITGYLSGKSFRDP
ncbi:hypothetical protein [Ruegeria sp. HKCCE4148]|uniref:hypothetical protein n=1 Tax=unclassified Ruegeria TaxID=2625375 RepID=UPI0032AFB1BB